MATVKLSTVMVYSGHNYTFHLSDRVMVGEIAQYLSQYEPHLSLTTLEVAHPVQRDQRLRDIDIQMGDRLISFMQPVKHVDLPTPINPGDKVLRFSLGDFEIKSRGKKGILVGKPDETQQIIPDIDLGYFVAPESLEHVSRGCLWLSFDEYNRAWYASKLGQTRIMVDEFELGTDKLPLNDVQWLRFYRVTDDPKEKNSRALGAFQLHVEEAKARDGILAFEPGNWRLNVHVGLESDGQTVRASESLRIEQVLEHLARYNGTGLPAEAQLYLARLISPEVKMHTLDLGYDAVLYASLNPRYGQNLLRLHDIHDREQIYVLSAGREDGEKIIGCRSQDDAVDPTLDVDFYDAIVGQGYVPETIDALSRQLGRIIYKTFEHTWWIRSDMHAQVPIFINNTRNLRTLAMVDQIQMVVYTISVKKILYLETI